jgi:hypothetical protein
LRRKFSFRLSPAGASRADGDEGGEDRKYFIEIAAVKFSCHGFENHGTENAIKRRALLAAL